VSAANRRFRGTPGFQSPAAFVCQETSIGRRLIETSGKNYIVMSALQKRIVWISTIVIPLCVLLGPLGAAPPEVPKISLFAPAKDLLQQVDFFVARIEESLADPADFDGAKQSRTRKDANTLAALALVLAVHDEDHPSKAGMPALLKAAQSLADAGDDAQKAAAGLEAIRQARSARPPASEPVKWEKSASTASLMKQVPLVHSGLKRGVEPNRLARQAAQSAGQAASIAAIAQAAMLDDEYAKSPDDARRWIEMCAEMRDAAGEVNSAVHAQDQARVSTGMKRLAQSCESCHARFRQP
jgi:hypothetical protein